jgi:WD40 repeat protein
VSPAARALLETAQLHRAIGSPDLLHPLVEKLCERPSDVRFIGVCQGGEDLATGSGDHTARLWDVTSHQ